MARLAAALWACGGMVALLLAAFPQPPNGSRTQLLALGGLAVAVAGLLRLGAKRLPGWMLPATAAMATLLTSLLTLASAGESWLDVQVVYIWVALGSAYVFSRRQVLVQVALIVASYGLVLGVTEPMVRAAPRWTATVASTVAAAVLVSALRSRVAEIVSRLADAARTDPLTGLQNRRGFEESFGAEVERAAREGRELAVLLGDLDHFKSLNDQLGHPAGDAALVRVGQLLLAGMRRPDAVARTGGEEFALLLPAAGGEMAWAIAERMRSAVEEAFGGDPVPLTISLGLASYPKDGITADELLAAADQALYAAKQLGRNRSVIYSEEIAPLVRQRAASADVQLATLLGLAEALDMRDSGTADHCRAVGRYCGLIAQQLGFPPDRVKRVETAGVLHDVGKIGLPDEILQKPGTLTEEEWKPLRRHPEIGARILADEAFADIREWIIAHHERIDGEGYPYRLSGEEIPLEARIIAVADAYVAMIGERVYCAVRTPEDARGELLRCAGTQFDPAIVAAFVGALHEEQESVPEIVSRGLALVTRQA